MLFENQSPYLSQRIDKTNEKIVTTRSIRCQVGVKTEVRAECLNQGPSIASREPSMKAAHLIAIF